MGYLTTWKVLEEIIADFRKRGLTIPAEIMDDLKSAKTLINVLKADPCRDDTSQKVEAYLLNLESYLISQAQIEFGSKYVEEWLNRLDKASQKPNEEEQESETRFVPGVPREQKWIRVKPTGELTLEKIRQLAEESELSISVQNDGYVLVYGSDDRIKELVKKMATKCKQESEK